ncbi:ATPase component NikO of energizing module of nickel ECF transporter [plant metagenome]|uniref:ATPase component NikO of energizing module of nickel ECF transporter n=1 Tax=plant metagenome TaxID=1297885 RepID=A0A484T6X5_9ZZZZ
MLELRQLAIQAGTRRLLSGLSLSVEAGSILAVLGPNGRGKTTLLRTIMGLQDPAEGLVRLGGPAAYVPQQTDTLFAYDVLAIVAMGRARHLRWYASPSRQDLRIARESLAAVGLSHLAAASYHSLSGGQRQLVCMARALAAEAPLLVLDEPMAALDLRNQDTILALLKHLSRTRGLTVVFSTHQPQHACHIADQTLLMHFDACESGPTADMCVDERLSRLYQLPVRVTPLSHEGRRIQGVVPLFR